jgi:virginiamycin B lyase
MLPSTGAVWAWGDNSSFQLGDGTTTQHNAPVQVMSPSVVNMTDVAAGSAQSFAIRGDGTVWAWGNAPLGEASNTNRPVPEQVLPPGGSGITFNQIVAVSSRGLHTVAERAAPGYGIFTWGVNDNGQIGNGSSGTPPALTPVLVWPPPPPAPVNYVALGDSYSAGQGIPGTFLPGTDGSGDFCHRSSAAYSEVISQARSLPLNFWACDGAQTADILTNTYQTEPPQITRPGVDPSAGLLTLTIGGNNAGFGDVLEWCIAQKAIVDGAAIYGTGATGAVLAWMGVLSGVESCTDVPGFVDSHNQQIDNIFGPVKDTYRAIKRAVSPTNSPTDTPNTSVIVADYPHLFPDSAQEQSCAGLSSFLTASDMQYINAGADRIDYVLQQATAQAGVNFVDVRQNFTGHAVCGNGGAWINGVTTTSGGGTGLVPIKGSFHPTEAGQASGYAEAIQQYINSATVRTPAGYPRNPDPLPDTPAPAAARTAAARMTAAQTPSVAVQSLTLQPDTSGSADCEGTFQAGQTLSASGGGFAPGASVRLFVESPGLGNTAEQQVAQVTADSTGSISTPIRIPLGATGFNVPGSTVGMSFVNAIGLGPGGTHVDDIAWTGLAPHSSLCGTVEAYPFSGFQAPVNNPPQINAASSGQTIPVKFSLAGSNAVLTDVLAAGYPQSAAVPCSSPPLLTTGDSTSPAPSSSGMAGDVYDYEWKTDPSWFGCRELIVKLVDGSYHRAFFNFGSLWFAETVANKIGRVDTTGGFTEFPIPTSSSGPLSITSGPDGAQWFTENSANKIGRVTSAGTFSEFPIPTANSRPFRITTGPDGALWFTESTGNRIGRITTSGAVSEFPIPTANSGSFGITSGPDGALWFTEAGTGKIGRVTTTGTFTEYSIPAGFPGPSGITSGPDGALWFTEAVGNKIARVTTSGTFTQYAVPTARSVPADITAGPDGALWFTEANSRNKIGRVSVTGSVTEYAAPTANAVPAGITAGPDGALWFTEANANKIGRVTTTGTFIEYPVPTARSGPAGIGAGP